jgi:competence protein ComEC
MWGGLLRGGVALLWPSAADRANVLLEWPAAALRDVALLISRVPTISWELAPPPIWWVTTFYVVIVLLLLRPRVRVLGWPAVLGAAALALSAAWRYLPIDAGRDGLRIRVLAVGDGTATVMSLPDGRTVLYDAGTLGGFDAAKTVIVPSLRHDGVRRIAHAHVSHPNLDHYSEVLGVHASVPIRELSVNALFKPLADGGAAEQFISDIDRLELPLRVLEPGELMVAAAGVTFETIWPPRNGESLALSANDSSTVLRVTYVGVRVLMCGDISEAAQRVLLDGGADLSADVLVLPHHGAVVASTAEFVAAVGADVLIRSSARGEERTSPALAEIVRGATYYNTADDGAVTIAVSRNGDLAVTPFIE